MASTLATQFNIWDILHCRLCFQKMAASKPAFCFRLQIEHVRFLPTQNLPTSRMMISTYWIYRVSIYVTGFAKRGSSSTHIQFFWFWRNITWCLSNIQAWNFHHFLHYISTLNCTICRPITFTHLKFWIVEVCKSDVCGRPLFAIWSSYV